MTIQAIQTKYNGYHFRSRLEARWAVFFDALGIQWRYEEQGFELPSGNYLPDFYLPEQDYFMEIKGTCPTILEREKASELSTLTGKVVFIFSGDIPTVPDLENDMYGGGRDFSVFYPGTISFYMSLYHFSFGRDGHVEIPLCDIDIQAKELYTEFKVFAEQSREYISRLRDQGVAANVTVKHLRKNLSQCAWQYLQRQWPSIEDHLDWHFAPCTEGGSDHPHIWGQCYHCGKFSIGFSGWDDRLDCKEVYGERTGCPSKRKERSWSSPHLIRAYESARSARFEYGETPKVPRGKAR